MVEAQDTQTETKQPRYSGKARWYIVHAYSNFEQKVAEAIRTMDTREGPAKFFPGGRMKFDEQGRRVDADLIIVQWQNGVPITVYPPASAVAQPIWPKQ